MADYNVNMKQWNGASFDNVLPLAYNSKTLEGKTYADITQYVQSVAVNSSLGKYAGNGTSQTIICGFKPDIVFIVGVRQVSGARNSYTTFVYGDEAIYISSGSGNFTKGFYITDNGFYVVSNYYDKEFSSNDNIYYYCAIKF